MGLVDVCDKLGCVNRYPLSGTEVFPRGVLPLIWEEIKVWRAFVRTEGGGFVEEESSPTCMCADRMLQLPFVLARSCEIMIVAASKSVLMLRIFGDTLCRLFL